MAEDCLTVKPLATDRRVVRSLLESGRDGGSLYKVDLPDEHIAKMLDWDKPLSQQAPEVQEAARVAASVNARQRAAQRLADAKIRRSNRSGKTATGRRLRETRALPAAGAELRRPRRLNCAQGIPGIRYLDGGSRGAGTGTSNYVVFPGNEDLLRILERNGQPLK